MPLTASKSFRYGGRALEAGDPFTATRGDARALVAIGRATYAVATAEPQITKDSQAPIEIEAEPQVAEEKAPDESAPKRRGKKASQ